MTALEHDIAMLGISGADLVGLAAGGWLVASLLALLAVRQAARAECLGLRAAEAAHELRGPLCAARLALTSLERAAPDAPAVVRGVATVDLELRRAGLALDELRSLHRSGDHGAAPAGPPQPELVDLHVLATAAGPAWKALAATHRKTLDMRIAGAPALARGDERELARAVGNLVANACEHGRGPVLVTVSGNASGALVEVADRGNGPAARIVRRARQRASGKRPRRRENSVRGHGMAVAARAAAANGGRLDVRVMPAGAVVSLTLPSNHVTGRSAATRWGARVWRRASGFEHPRTPTLDPPLAATR